MLVSAYQLERSNVGMKELLAEAVDATANLTLSHPMSVMKAAFSRDGRSIVTIDLDEKVRVRDHGTPTISETSLLIRDHGTPTIPETSRASDGRIGSR